MEEVTLCGLGIGTKDIQSLSVGAMVNLRYFDIGNNVMREGAAVA